MQTIFLFFTLMAWIYAIIWIGSMIQYFRLPAYAEASPIKSMTWIFIASVVWLIAFYTT